MSEPHEPPAPAPSPDDVLHRLVSLSLEGSGEGTLRIREQVEGAARAMGVDARVLVLPDQAVLTVTRADAPPVVDTIDAVPGIGRLDRVSDLERVWRRLVDREATAEQTGVALDEIARRPAPYAWWWRVLGVVLFAAGFAPSVQSRWTEVGQSVVLGAIMGVILVTLEPTRYAPLLPFVGSFVVTLVALQVFDAAGSPGGPVLMVVPALFVVIPGDYISAAAVELAVGQLSAGATRIVAALFQLLSLVVGVLVATSAVGVGPQALFEAEVTPALPLWVSVLAWVPFTVGLALVFAVLRRDVPWVLAGVYLAWVVLALGTRVAGEAAGTFVAAVALAAFASLVARRPDAPPRVVVLIGGFFVLTVGALGLRGLTTLVGGHPIVAVTDLTTMVTIALALAFGLVAGAAATVRR